MNPPQAARNPERRRPTALHGPAFVCEARRGDRGRDCGARPPGKELPGTGCATRAGVRTAPDGRRQERRHCVRRQGPSSRPRREGSVDFSARGCTPSRAFPMAPPRAARTGSWPRQRRSPGRESGMRCSWDARASRRGPPPRISTSMEGTWPRRTRTPFSCTGEWESWCPGGLPAPQRLDAGNQRAGPAARHGLHARWRL